MEEIKTFNNPEFGDIRTLTINNEPWFVGKDVAQVLGYRNPSEAMAEHVDPDDKLNSKTLSSFQLDLGQRGGWLINESGLYSLILSSKLSSAKRFKHWVTSEVLPAIRRNGGYIAGQEELTDAEIMAKALMVARKTIEDRDRRIGELSAANAKLVVSNQILQPKADYFDELVERNLLTSFRDTAKELGIPPRKFTQFLVDHKYLYRDKKGMLMPYTQKNNGLFEIKETKNDKTGWVGLQTMITPKGRETFRLLMIL